MDENEFWKIIKLVDQVALDDQREEDAGMELVSELSARSEEEIKGFYRCMTDALYAIDTRNHFDAAPVPLADDSFLLFRCYIVGKGRRFYESVRREPSKRPDRFGSFEYLLSVAEIASSIVTGRNEFDYSCVSKSFESGSNFEGWFVLGQVSSISFRDTRQSVEAMLAADKRQSASLGHELSDFVNCLKKVDFRSKYSFLEFTLNPKIEHGSITLTRTFNESSNEIGGTAKLDLGFDAEKFITMNPSERKEFFVEAARAALLCLHDGRGETEQQIAKAKQLM